MSELSVVKQKLADLTATVNNFIGKAKKTDQFTFQAALNADSKIRVFINGESQYITVQQIVESSVLSQYNYGINGIVSGTIEYTGGLSYKTNNLVYRFNNVLYYSNGFPLTSNPNASGTTRLDVFYGDSDLDGQLFILEGVAGLEPSLEWGHQIKLLIAVIENLATAPLGVSNILWYGENLQEVGGEKNTSTPNPTFVTLDSIEQAFLGTKSVKIVNRNHFDLNSTVKYLGSNLSNVFLKVWCKDSTNNSLRLQLWVNGTMRVGEIYVAHGTFNFDAFLINQWQTIIIPGTAFRVGGAWGNEEYDYMYVGNNKNGTTIFIDDVRIQQGTSAVLVPSTHTHSNYNVLEQITQTFINNCISAYNWITTNGAAVLGKQNKLIAGTNITIDETDPDNPVINAAGGGATTAAAVSVDASAFAGNLALTDNTVQKVANKVDGLILGGEATAPAVSATYATIAAMLAAQGDQILNAFYKVDDASADPTITSGKAVYQYLGTTFGTLADYDLIWKLDSGVVSGSTLPTTGLDTGLFYRVDKANRHILMQYNGAGWNSVRSFGEMKIWVSPTGTDNVNYGDGTGVNAFRTIAYAIEQIPPQYYGDVYVVIQAGTYNEEVYVNGKNAVGDFKIKISGEYTSITGSFTSIARDTTLGRFKPSDSTKSWTTNEHKYKFLHITSGINIGCVLPIISNTATELTCPYETYGYRKDFYNSDYNITFGVSSNANTYEIITPTTLINGHIFSKGSKTTVQFLRYTSSSIALNYSDVFLGGVQLYVNGNFNSRFVNTVKAQMMLVGCSVWSTSASTYWALLQNETANIDIRACFFDSFNVNANGIIFWTGCTGVIISTTLLGKLEMAVNSSVGFGWDSATTCNITAINVYSSSVGQRLNTTKVVGTKTIDAGSYGVSTTS